MLHNKESSETQYNQLLSLPQWEAKRMEILYRDNNTCRSCGSKDFLQVHHKQYHIAKSTKKFKDPWSYDETNLITLCNRCHESGHRIYKIPVFIVNN